MKTITIQIKNMICPSCIFVVRKILDDLNIEHCEVGVGYALVPSQPEPDLATIDELLREVNMGLIEDPNELVVSRIRLGIFDYLNKVMFIQDTMNLSDYLIKEIGLNYPQLSKLFKLYRGQTIEQFYIQIRTEKVKDLIREGRFNHSQIAHILGFSSLQYLSTQFKKAEGMTMSEYRDKWNRFLGFTSTDNKNQDVVPCQIASKTMVSGVAPLS